MKIKRNNSLNSSALRRRRIPGGFGPLPTDEPGSSQQVKRGIRRSNRKTKVYIAVSSDLPNKRFTAFQGLIARALCLRLGNRLKRGNNYGKKKG